MTSQLLDWRFIFISEKGLNISFSKVEYPKIAEAVGLSPMYGFNDVPLFDIRVHRSRIPTALFRDILADIDLLSSQYGTLVPRHLPATEEERSRVLAPARRFSV